MTRTAPISLAARALASFGNILWGLAAIYGLVVVTSGFVDWAAPNVYASALVVICGLTVNVLLFRRADTVSTISTATLMLASFTMSAVIVSVITWMAVGR